MRNLLGVELVESVQVVLLAGHAFLRITTGLADAPLLWFDKGLLHAFFLASVSSIVQVGHVVDMAKLGLVPRGNC